MKYKEGNIVLLESGETVYISFVDEKEKKYHVYDTDDENKVYIISENSIFMLIT